MKRAIFIVCCVLAVAGVLALSQVDAGVVAQVEATPYVIAWDEYQYFEAVVAPELIGLFIDLQVRCDGQVVLSQVLDLNGPALELGEGVFREYDWSWGGWTPPDMPCSEWERIRWEVPEAAGAVLDGEQFIGQIYGLYEAPEGEDTWSDENNFWYLGLLADDGDEWYDSCPGLADCSTPAPTLTPRPTLTPAPEPTCRPTPTCPGVTPYPTEPPYSTATPWPTQPPL